MARYLEYFRESYTGCDIDTNSGKGSPAHRLGDEAIFLKRLVSGYGAFGSFEALSVEC
jgi:hypothetical protein